MATTSEKFGTSFSGTGWSNPSNAGASDNSYAISNAGAANVTLNAFDAKAPDFSEIGDSEPVTQLVVRIECMYSSRPVRLETIQLLRSGSLYGSTQGPSATLTTSDQVLTYTFDLSAADWTGADVKNANSGVRLIFKRTTGKGTGSALVDGVTFQATYAPSSTTTTAAGSGGPKTTLGSRRFGSQRGLSGN